MQHLDEGTIHAWLDGALPADEAADVERHARECADCAGLIADARGVIAGVARIVSALDDVPAGAVPKARTASESRSLWRTLRVTPFRAAIAASLMVFAASLAVIRHAPHDAATPPRVPPAASAPLAVDVNDTRPSEQKQTVNAAEKKLNRASITVPPVAAPPAPMSETKSAAPKATASPLESVARDAAKKVREEVMSPVADSIDRRIVVVEAQREVPKAPVSAPAAANAAIVGDVARGKALSAQLRATVAGPMAQPFRMMLTSADNQPLVVPACYQLVRDTTSLARLPERFSLESDSAAGARHNIVRALTADGRRDSVIAGVTWQAAPGFSSGVLIVSDGPIVPAFRREAAPTLREDAARSSSGQVNRIACR
jgi:hypothetical protein